MKQDVERTYPVLATHLMENFVPLAERPVKAPPEGIPVIGALGRLHVNKGFDILLQAAALLRERGMPVKLQIAGDGPEAGTLRTLAARLGLQAEDLTFTGWVTGPADYLAKLDLFVLPSRVEPFGLVVVEAMAAGVPVIASDIDGPRTILKSGELGAMVAPEDPSALADAIAVCHVELILIHPFREGNGRVSRLLADVMAVQAGHGPLDYSGWDEDKTAYFTAIQCGVGMDYAPMRALVSVALAGRDG